MTSSEILRCEKLIKNSQVIGIDVQVKLSRAISGQSEPYSWKYSTTLSASDEANIKSAIEKWITSGIIQEFDKNADQLEAKSVEEQPIKQAIDTSSISLDLTVPEPVVEAPVEEDPPA